jgi:hypothetical protein
MPAPREGGVLQVEVLVKRLACQPKPEGWLAKSKPRGIEAQPVFALWATT